MKRGIFIQVNGNITLVEAKNKRSFKYEELQTFVGNMVEITPMPGGRNLICHEEGKLIGLAKNEKATEIWKREYPITKYPHNNDELVVGDVLITGRSLEGLMKDYLLK